MGLNRTGARRKGARGHGGARVLAKGALVTTAVTWAAASIPGCVLGVTTIATMPIEAGAGSGGGGGASSSSWVIPSGSWVNVTSNLAGIVSECGTVSIMTVRPDGSTLIAGVAGVGLYQSTDGGGTWAALGSSVDGGVPVANSPLSFVFDPKDPTHWWETGIHHGDGIFATTDDGATFTSLARGVVQSAD